MKKRIGIILFFLLLTMPFQLNASEKRSFAIAAEAIRSKPDSVVIRFSVRNITQKPIRIFTALLPWKNSSSAIYILRADPGALQENDQVSFGFPAAGETTIEPKEEIFGEISLKNLFTKAPTLVTQKGGLLYWSYVYDSESDPPVGRELYGGVMLLKE